MKFTLPALATPKLSAILSLLFVSLSIPILIFILLYSHHKTSVAIMSNLHEQVAKTRLDSIEDGQYLINPVATALRLLSGAAASDPALFRTEQSRELLYRALTSAAQIDAIYVSFEDGYHRVVTRVDDDRRRSDPKIPPTANWHSSYIDDFSDGKNRRRHRMFFDSWPNVVGRYDSETTVDIRLLPHYRAAKATGSLAVTEPSINPDTGYPVLSLGFPILRDDKFVGFAGANITLNLLSRFLDRHRASPHSTTTIVERGGTIIAYPDSAKQVQKIDGKLAVARVANIADDDLREAYRLRTQMMGDNFLFRSPVTKKELSASFDRFPEGFPRPWETVILTPTDDFVGSLKAVNRQMVVVITVLTVFELLLIYAFSRRISKPIESVSRQLMSMETFSLEDPPGRESKTKIREIAELQGAVTRVRASLRSFARYAPEETVREVAASGQETILSAGRREVTALFCDLRGFTSFAEKLAPEEVVTILNDHFDTISGLIARHGGYVVDFLGDGLFAVFGAPEAAADHAARAVTCAIEMQLAREASNLEYFAKGWPPLEMGVGINSGLAVVGNMGSHLRIKYGVVGHPVNLAARIESFTVGGQVLISDSTRETLADRLVADGPVEAEAKGVNAPIRIWMVRRLEGASPLELPSLTSNLVVLPSVIEVGLRPVRGKQIGADVYPAELVKLGVSGAELRTTCPMATFDAVQVILPLEAGVSATLASKVISVTEQAAGRRTAVVRFGGLGWDERAKLEALSRAGHPAARAATSLPASRPDRARPAGPGSGLASGSG